MADDKYIEQGYARAKVNIPCGRASPDELEHAIVDATDQIDPYLKAAGVTATLPLAVGNQTDDFKLAVAFWVGSILYYANGQMEQGKEMLKYAQGLMDKYIATHNFGTDAITEPNSEPTFYQYSNKGDLVQTDLSDPLDLSENST